MQNNQINTQVSKEGLYSFFHSAKKVDETSHKNYFGKLILMVCITAGVVILFSSIISKARQERFSLLEGKKKLESQTSRLEAVNLKLENERSALKNDPISIEREARDRLGFITPDEVTYTKYNFHIKGITKEEPPKVIHQNRWKTFLFDGPFPWQFPALIILIATAYYLITYHFEYRKLHQSNC
ncbi:MAG: septum formation initiator family protein [Planctomycetota bacterium]